MILASIGTAGAQRMPPPPGQFPPPPAAAPESPPPAPAVPKRAPAARGPDIAGTWSGAIVQVGGNSRYNVVMKITGTGGETDYPELNCGGKVTRVGASKSYVFFVEIISRGQAEKGGRCPDGTITVARAGDNLNWEWFGSVKGEIVLAYGTLSRQTGR
jgi:hypothetical protein